MVTIRPIIQSTGSGLVYNEYDIGTSFGWDTGGYIPNDMQYTVLLGVMTQPVWLGYYTFIYYNGTLLWYSGASTSLDSSGNPINWPPPANQYESISLGGRSIKTAKVVPLTNYHGAQQQYYLLPDIHYESIKNGITFPSSNTTIENTIQAGSHFRLGLYANNIRWDNETGAKDLTYYGITKFASPPLIYRNSIAVEDGADTDFNDVIATLTSGDGFFTGTVQKNTTAPTQQSYTYGTTTANWGKFSGNTFILNISGNITFKIRRDASVQNKILLYKGSSSGQYAEIIPNSGSESSVDVTFSNMEAGTYQVACQVGGNYSSNQHVMIRNIDINKYPSIY